jgi:hypothetical protein
MRKAAALISLVIITASNASFAGNSPKSVYIKQGAVVAISEQTLDLLEQYANDQDNNAIDTMYAKHQLFKMPERRKVQVVSLKSTDEKYRLAFKMTADGVTATAWKDS